MPLLSIATSMFSKGLCGMRYFRHYDPVSISNAFFSTTATALPNMVWAGGGV